jgi:hypothetical protein
MYISDDAAPQAAAFRARIEDELEQFGRLIGVRHAEAFKYVDAR